MSRNYFFGVIVLLMLAVSVSGFAEETRTPVGRKSIQIRLDQPTKTDRTALPITGGMFFPKGELASADNIRILDTIGRETASQARCLSCWPDNSVKAALLDFRADVPLDKETFYAIEYGATVKPMPRPVGIQVKKEGERVIVDTGVLKFSVSKSGCGWMDEVTVGGKMVGKGLNFARFKGDTAPNKAVVTAMEVEEGGDLPNPLRAVLKIEGYYEGHLKTPFILRIHAYVGKAFVRVFHTFIYAGDRFKPEDHLVEMEIGIELASGIKNILYGIEGETAVEPKLENGVALFYSKDDLNYTITGATIPPLPTDKPAGWWMDAKGKPAGWMSISSNIGNVQMGVRDMWQNYPKGLRVEGNKATLALWPKEHAPFDLKTNHRFLVDKDVLAKWNDADPENEQDRIVGTHASNGLGSAKTHELYFHFQVDQEQAKLAAAFAAFQEPTYLFANPTWHADTRLFWFYNPVGVAYQDSNLKR